jgi:hypothetical protein
MGGLFKQPKVQKPEAPKPVRMPVQTDPAVEQAAQRTRAAALMRQGRLSTILTDQTRATTGSSGQKLGA